MIILILILIVLIIGFKIKIPFGIILKWGGIIIASLFVIGLIFNACFFFGCSKKEKPKELPVIWCEKRTALSSDGLLFCVE